jgi:hypothetical protein
MHPLPSAPPENHRSSVRLRIGTPLVQEIHIPLNGSAPTPDDCTLLKTIATLNIGPSVLHTETGSCPWRGKKERSLETHVNRIHESRGADTFPGIQQPSTSALLLARALVRSPEDTA